MHGAKGSVKNRVYQFWLIKKFREKIKKRKQKKMLKKKQMEEMRKKVIQEVIGVKDTRVWKLSPNPPMIKKEGTKIVLSPIGKKPPRVIEAYEVQPTIGHLKPKKEISKEVISQQKKAMESIPKAEPSFSMPMEKIKNVQNKNLEQKMGSKIDQPLKHSIERTANLSQDIAIPEIKVVSEKKIQEIPKNEGKTSSIQSKKGLAKENMKKATIHTKVISTSTGIIIAFPAMISLYMSQKTNKSEKENQKTITEDPIKENQIIHTKMISTSVGVITAFPAMTSLYMSQKINKSKKENQRVATEEPTKPNSKKSTEIKTIKVKKVAQKQKSNKSDNKENQNTRLLKLYRSKIQANLEAEILIKAEIERQENYLRRQNEMIEKVERSKKMECHFRNIHYLFENMFTFALGFFTIPLSRHRFFGTVLGLTLIGNSIRGMRENLSKDKNRFVYLQWKEIHTEQQAVQRLNDLVVDSLTQINGLKKDLEREFFGKVPFAEYDDIKYKLKVMELKMIEKYKQIEAMEEELKIQEEKNKVKMKQMRE